MFPSPFLIFNVEVSFISEKFYFIIPFNLGIIFVPPFKDLHDYVLNVQHQSSDQSSFES
jgi:hypothetical protein